MIRIRRARPSDAADLTRIALAAKGHWGYPEYWMELWTPQLTFDGAYIEQYESWVAVKEEQPVAFLTLLERSEVAWLENLWVMPESIGKGIGRALFLHAVELARQRGYTSLQLEADPNAAGFYEKMGMVQIGERHYEVDGQPRRLPLMEIGL